MALLNVPRKVWFPVAWLVWVVVWSAVALHYAPRGNFQTGQGVLATYNSAMSFIFVLLGLVFGAWQANKRFGVVSFQ